MLTKLTTTFAFVFAGIAACGGGTPESSTPPAGSQTPTTTTAAPSSSAAPMSAQDHAAKLEAQHDGFVSKCMGKSPMKEYCECGFEQFKVVFKDADLDKDPSPELLETLKTKTISACADKLPEPTLKTSFVTSCTGTDNRKGGYCECAWTSLRKTLSLADFATGLSGSHFDEAKKRMVGECKGKLPDAVVKGEFMDACTKEGDPKGCECVWKKVRGKFSAEEIAAGLADLKAVPSVAECKKK